VNESVLFDRDGDIVTLTLHNPRKMNAFSHAMRDRLIELLVELNADSACRAIVFTGHGEHFSAGADLAGFEERTVRECRVRMKRGSARLMREMVAGAKPMIAAVEGNAYGAGLALASACDHVVASRSAKFCCAFTRVGFMPDLGLMHTLPQLGLADDLAPVGGALASARAIARRYADGPPLAFEMVKGVLARGLEAMIQAEIDLQPMLWLSEDHREGKRAFADRRRPRFTGT
jgi:enoyl-CoA hydratase/carnithine racemase